MRNLIAPLLLITITITFSQDCFTVDLDDCTKEEKVITRANIIATIPLEKAYHRKKADSEFGGKPCWGLETRIIVFDSRMRAAEMKDLGGGRFAGIPSSKKPNYCDGDLLLITTFSLFECRGGMPINYDSKGDGTFFIGEDTTLLFRQEFAEYKSMSRDQHTVFRTSGIDQKCDTWETVPFINNPLIDRVEYNGDCDGKDLHCNQGKKAPRIYYKPIKFIVTYCK